MQKSVGRAATLGIIAILPILALAYVFLVGTADREVGRFKIAAPLGHVCQVMTKPRSLSRWFPWHSEASQEILRAPRKTMLTVDFKFYAFADYSDLAGNAFTAENVRGKCKPGAEKYELYNFLKFGPRPSGYWSKTLRKYKLRYELIAHEGHTEVIAFAEDCSRSRLTRRSYGCWATSQNMHDVFSTTVAEGMTTLAPMIEKRAPAAASCGAGTGNDHHTCAEPEPAGNAFNYVAFLLTMSIFGALAGLAYHLMRHHFARFPDQLFNDEAWDKASDSQHAFEKDVLGIQFDSLGFWDARSPRNLAICAGVGALAPLCIGLIMWGANDAVLTEACKTIGLFHLEPLFCS